MTASTPRPIIGIALEPFGWHPAAFAEVGADPQTATSADHWIGLVRSAGAAADFVTFEDSFTLTARDRLTGRFDAVLLASRIAPAVRDVGLVPMVTATHTEPFHASTALATLDYVSDGRAGVHAVTTGGVAAAQLFGRKAPQDTASQAAEAREFIHVLRGLWDSWEDDAVIKDIESGRYVDRDRLHYLDFVGEHFSVKGPSITPRPPQGQPVVLVTVSDDESAAVARDADVALIEFDDETTIRQSTAALRGSGVQRVLVDLTVFLADSERTARRRWDKLELRQRDSGGAVFTGTGAALAERVELIRSWGADGVRFRPGVNSVDLPRLRDAFVPLLSAPREGATLREKLALRTAVNRFTKAKGA